MVQPRRGSKPFHNRCYYDGIKNHSCGFGRSKSIRKKRKYRLAKKCYLYFIRVCLFGMLSILLVQHKIRKMVQRPLRIIRKDRYACYQSQSGSIRSVSTSSLRKISLFVSFSHPFIYFPTFYMIKGVVKAQPIQETYQKYKAELWDNCKVRHFPMN